MQDVDVCNEGKRCFKVKWKRMIWQEMKRKYIYSCYTSYVRFPHSYPLYPYPSVSTYWRRFSSFSLRVLEVSSICDTRLISIQPPFLTCREGERAASPGAAATNAAESSSSRQQLQQPGAAVAPGAAYPTPARAGTRNRARAAKGDERWGSGHNRGWFTRWRYRR